MYVGVQLLQLSRRLSTSAGSSSKEKSVWRQQQQQTCLKHEERLRYQMHCCCFCCCCFCCCCCCYCCCCCRFWCRCYCRFCLNSYDHKAELDSFPNYLYFLLFQITCLLSLKEDQLLRFVMFTVSCCNWSTVLLLKAFARPGAGGIHLNKSWRAECKVERLNRPFVYHLRRTLVLSTHSNSACTASAWFKFETREAIFTALLPLQPVIMPAPSSNYL